LKFTAALFELNDSSIKLKTERNMTNTSAESRPWYKRIGPGLITACMVIGPGSLMTSSTVGAEHGYSKIWIVIVSCFVMMAYVTMGARLGVVAKESPGTLVANRFGRWLAILIGVCVFLIASAFQFGNNLGIHSAFSQFTDFSGIVIIMNLLSLVFLFAAPNLYRWLERMMMFFVALMLISFALNLFFAKPSLSGVLQGTIPNFDGIFDVAVLGMIGTTFIVAAAYYQAYLVRQRGWGIADMRDGMLDARVSALIMLVITLIIMTTAGAVLRGKELAGVGDVAQQLEPLFGVRGKILFSLGLFCAAYSSFIVNSMVGGFVLSDGLGWGSDVKDWRPRLLSAAAMLTGMFIALVVIHRDIKPVPAIVIGQAVTVIAGPLLAGMMLFLTNSKSVMGEKTNGPILNGIGLVGFIFTLLFAWNTTVHKIPAGIQKMQQQKEAPTTMLEPLEIHDNQITSWSC